MKPAAKTAKAPNAQKVVRFAMAVGVVAEMVDWEAN